eukprot:351168-Chlamydomonas_euryale.AAC.1
MVAVAGLWVMVVVVVVAESHATIILKISYTWRYIWSYFWYTSGAASGVHLVYIPCTCGVTSGVASGVHLVLHL